MMKKIVVTLLTDFGLSDPYVGIMKGVIAGIDPSIPVIDISHDIPAQNIYAASYCLKSAYKYFPEGSVHVAVVDPGVGTVRRALAIELASGFLVGPDNGLFSGVLMKDRIKAVVELDNKSYWRTETPSGTFHGRDIFAPVGAHLASGVSLRRIGSEIDPDSIMLLDIPAGVKDGSSISGCIEHVDHFGNLITNIPGDWLTKRSWSVVVADTGIEGGAAYGDAAPGRAVAVIGSHGFLEIAVNGGSAASLLNAGWRMPVQVVLK
jgi:S-adenosyl-L-methionine hydrolase (adenosine-forming)